MKKVCCQNCAKHNKDECPYQLHKSTDDICEAYISSAIMPDDYRAKRDKSYVITVRKTKRKRRKKK